ncbi:MAG: hypothetical protein OEU84_14560 [Xanthomonadales bacterium]|nr:hypothetical protein [Xanthomonadales bacterium]
MYSPKMRSFWVDFPVSAEQYSKLELRWRRRQNYYEIKNSPAPDVRIRSFCTFGGEDYRIISLEARGDIDAYNNTLKIMEKWIVESLGEY